LQPYDSARIFSDVICLDSVGAIWMVSPGGGDEVLCVLEGGKDIASRSKDSISQRCSAVPTAAPCARPGWVIVLLPESTASRQCRSKRPAPGYRETG
jgi:hypothetical protein